MRPCSPQRPQHQGACWCYVPSAWPTRPARCAHSRASVASACGSGVHRGSPDMQVSYLSSTVSPHGSRTLCCEQVRGVMGRQPSARWRDFRGCVLFVSRFFLFATCLLPPSGPDERHAPGKMAAALSVCLWSALKVKYFSKIFLNVTFPVCFVGRDTISHPAFPRHPTCPDLAPGVCPLGLCWAWSCMECVAVGLAAWDAPGNWAKGLGDVLRGNGCSSLKCHSVHYQPQMTPAWQLLGQPRCRSTGAFMAP